MNNYDNPARERVKKSDMVAWLLAHPDVWWNYPDSGKSPEAMNHSRRIFHTMQSAGLFTPRSQCNAKTITRLVEAAMASSVISGTSNGTEMIKP